MKIKVKAISIRRCSPRPAIHSRDTHCAVSEGIARRAGVVKGKAASRRNQMRGCPPVCIVCLCCGLITPCQIFSHIKSCGSREAAPSFQLFTVHAGQIPTCLLQPFPVPPSTASVINIHSGANQHGILHTYYLNLSKLTERWSLWGLINCSSGKGHFD